MGFGSVVNILLRPLQLAFVAIVLGLSGALVHGQYAGGSPAVTNFAVACGTFGAIAMLAGLASIFVSALQGVIMLALDAIATLFFLAGSIALAAKLGVHSCDGDRPPGWDNTQDGTKPPNPYTTYNSVINGGAITFLPPNSQYSFDFYEPDSYFVSRCREAQALDAFMFFSLAAFAASMLVDLLSSRGRKSGSSV